jgi:murein hydrolase activator
MKMLCLWLVLSQLEPNLALPVQTSEAGRRNKDTEPQILEEHADLAERLAAEKAAFDAMGAERKHLLTLLDTLERLALESKTKVLQLESQLAKVIAKAKVAEAKNQIAQSALQAQRTVLRPRLLALYRLHNKDSLGFLLTSNNFANLLKRSRGMQRVVKSDLGALEILFDLTESARLNATRLALYVANAKRLREVLSNEQAIGRARLSRFRDLLRSVKAEENRQSRLIADLEMSERALATLVADLKEDVTLVGFRALKGQLPFPVRGEVEVGFGKVVNPRFNTVTVQKGIDVKAEEGQPVKSVASGKVAFAGWLKGYGNLVIVDHGNLYHSLYAHLANTQVEVGQVIGALALVGQVGDTSSLKGPYLYFEIRKGGTAIDPLPWMIEP